jgi:hypothetical protein
MSDILLTRTSPSPTRTLRIRNFDQIDAKLDCPVMVYSIPESPDTDAIGMKVEGNMSTINLSWTLVDQTVTVVDELTGGSSILTADDQMAFLINDFQPVSIENAFEIKLLESDNSTVFFTRTGVVSSIAVSKGGDAPVTWTANIQFSCASMLATDDNIETNNG